MAKKQKDIEKTEEILDLSPQESSEKTSCETKKCRSWCCVFYIFTFIALAAGLYFGLDYQGNQKIKALEQKLNESVNLLQKDVLDLRQKTGAKSKAEGLIDTVLGTVQSRLQNLETGEPSSSFANRAMTLLYFEKDLDDEGLYLKDLLARFQKNLSTDFKDDLTVMEKILTRNPHVSQKALLDGASSIIAPQGKEAAPKSDSFFAKIKDYLLSLITIQKKDASPFNLDENIALKEALDEGDVYSINRIFTPHALKNEAIERWLRVCDDYRELKSTLQKIEARILKE